MTRKIMIADDSSTIQKVIKLAFAGFDVQINCVESFREALSVLATETPDLLIISAVLPGAHGAQDFKMLLASRGQSIAALMLIGSYDQIDQQALQDVGFRFFLTKPFDTPRLIGVVCEEMQVALTAKSAKPADQLSNPLQVSGSRGLQPPVSALTPGSSARDVRDPYAEEARSWNSNGQRPQKLQFSLDLDEQTGSNPQAPSAGDTFSDASPSFDTRGLRDLRADPASDGIARLTSGGASKVGAMSADIQDVVEKVVREYCDENLESIIRQVVEAELRRLAEDRARHLIDS